MRNSQVVRQWTVLQTIAVNPTGTTIETLSEDMGVNQKTIRRDLEALTQAGFMMKRWKSSVKRVAYKPVEDFGELMVLLDEWRNEPGMISSEDGIDAVITTSRQRYKPSNKHPWKRFR